MLYTNGAIPVPEGPELGIEVDVDRIRWRAGLYRELGDRFFDRDPSRQDWFSLVPNDPCAEPE